jgi:hypothetical protein
MPFLFPICHATPPLDRGMRQRLEQCLERLELVWYRLGAVRLGDGVTDTSQ